jgi:hypothetical protein
MAKPARDADPPLDAVLFKLPADVQQELTARFEDRLSLKLARYPDANSDALRSIVQQEHKNYVVKRRAPCYDLQHKGPCLDPTHCVAENLEHASKGKWVSVGRYVPDWIMDLLAEKVRIRNDSSEWRWIRLTSGPGPADDPNSLEDMVKHAARFRKRSGFRWRRFFGKRDSRPGRSDARFIRAGSGGYLLEGRVHLIPPDAPPRTHVRGGFSNVAMGGRAAPWMVEWNFLYYGAELGDEQRLARRWIRHPLNKGRTGVDCSVEPVREPAGALHKLQHYALDGLRLPGPKRVELDRLRADHRLIRVIRLGVGCRKGLRKKFARQWWAEALAEATREAYSNPSRACWSGLLSGTAPATPWEDALRKLESDFDRTAAHRWRWSRRWDLYGQLLYQRASEPSVRPSDFTHERRDAGASASATVASVWGDGTGTNNKENGMTNEQLALLVLQRLDALPAQVAERVREELGKSDQEVTKLRAERKRRETQ